MNTDKLLGMLLDAIDYSFLQSNGDYDKSLTYPVIDKVRYIKEKLKNKEVKEVDLEKEIELIKGDYEQVDVAWNNDFDYIARHFFELGLKANQENNVIGILEREVKIDAGGYPYIDCSIELYDYDKDIPLAKE